ncbi:M4 family metallopeptidase [Humibacillus xanthopallidus]|uniref:Neutral metalloproteinase n=1 Tax=Humibacillus xanthopallidus TaxID=412689 RepID=A0A543HTI0_9MICO|nr:M4 family metallopeptidase [Humibacillus xanthopallidus]TQM61645.1 griselysin [Humibacillus xanthopallidus]
MTNKRLITTVATAAIAATALATIATSGAQAATPAAAGSNGIDRAVAAATAHGAAFGLDRDQSLSSRSVATDPDGTTHVRFDRTFKGLPIVGGDLVVHTDKAGGWKGVNAASTAVRVASTTPTVAAATAAHTAAATADFTVRTSTPTLAVYAYGPARLVWKTQVDGVGAHQEPAGKVVFVDARTGAVVDQWATEINDAGTGNSLYLGTVTIQTTPSGGQWQMIDPARGNARTEDGNNGSTSSTTGTLFTDADNTWGTGSNTNRQSAAVDADFGVGATWDFYKNTFGRNGIKNDGKGARSLVHVGSNWVNASWSDTCFCMRYGDGDGVSYGPLVSLDVAGHEMTHGVTSATAGLAYRRESGGLNESTSDVMGTMVEFTANTAGDPGDYLIGERFSLKSPKKPLRWMNKPSTDGASADCWSKTVGSLDVHYSSGVGNHAFYLLAEGTAAKVFDGVTYTSPTCNGSSVTGIGRDAAAAIWYRALTTYWTSSTTYAGARAGMLSAATDLYGAGSTQYNATAAAWSAVNVN